ncbi:helix-turn-helix transcriptional regulator [Brevibacillus thermoruber]|uniref:Helix-turn-helix transcriptional regulator n=1 Tax=Brevibacillus thermoruber TaxID=33942 RepID=A0A9X3Z328_9BACL|nr:helix-turn-helix transcriptional regulator [Brevibacillus thermoruber]MDA5108229.1 helix-turn-helix transcriptional regulator [Brevibacillus thermoruber]
MLLRYRRQENITISELAERTGVSKSVLSRIESGETKRPGFTTCKKITRALQIPYASLVSSYLDVTERAEMLKFLLEEAVSLNNRSLVRKAESEISFPHIEMYTLNMGEIFFGKDHGRARNYY